MAEFVFKDLAKKENAVNEIYVASAATSDWEIGNPVHSGTRTRLLKEGISSDEKRAVKLVKSDYIKYDYIIGMEKSNIDDIMKIIGSDPQNKVHLLLDFAGGGEIADPWYTGDFDKTYDDVYAGCVGLMKKIKNQ